MQYVLVNSTTDDDLWFDFESLIFSCSLDIPFLLCGSVKHVFYTKIQLGFSSNDHGLQSYPITQLLSV